MQVSSMIRAEELGKESALWSYFSRISRENQFGAGETCRNQDLQSGRLLRHGSLTCQRGHPERTSLWRLRRRGSHGHSIGPNSSKSLIYRFRKDVS